MKFDGEALTGLVLAFMVLATILYFLFRFFGDCRADRAHAMERINWPTTTVTATLFDTHTKGSTKNRGSIIGHYRYEFRGTEHTFTRYEPFAGSEAELPKATRDLKEQGNTLELTIQYNPRDPGEATDRVITEIPGCLPWVSGFILLFSSLMFLVLRGFYITLFR